MTNLPDDFLHLMQGLLGEDFSPFLASLDQHPQAGLRVNTLKIAPQALLQRLPYDLQPVAWSSTGYSIQASSTGTAFPPPGKHPYHAAGLYYLQEPSAMAAAEMLNPRPGDFVLDLCAAPGGKSTHLAALMMDQGCLIANDIHSSRAREMVENLERWGAHNAAILNDTPTRLVQRFGAIFDKVLVDAPCSGEGMFRKSEAARQDWSIQLVKSCSLRQSAILEDAMQMVKIGGYLAYSTCTFNPRENEQVIAQALGNNPEFDLVETAALPGFSPGRPDWVEPALPTGELAHAARLWPHRLAGEGHFIALMVRLKDPRQARPPRAKVETERSSARQGTSYRKPTQIVFDIPSHLRLAFEDFCHLHLRSELYSEIISEGLLALVGPDLYLCPRNLPDLAGLCALRPGWRLGSFHTGKDPSRKRPPYRFEPSHAMALGLTRDDFLQILNLEPDAPSLASYMRGDVLRIPGDDGWVAICVDGFPLGWGKRVQGVVKNAYPAGLRRV